METTDEKIIYSLTAEDLQTVAKVVYGKELSSKEIEIVSEKIGDYFSDWFDKVDSAIENTLELEKLEEANWEEYPY